MKTLIAILALAIASTAAANVVDPPVDETLAKAAAIRAGDFIVRILDENGKYDYVVDPMAEDDEDDAYNLLRHAGTTYALCQLYDATEDEKYLIAAERANTWLKTQIHTVDVQGRRFTVPVSDPAITNAGKKSGRTIKTGGVALAIVALQSVDNAKGTTINRQLVEALADYILFVQEADGMLKSKYLLDDNYFSSWRSLYYPGEAMVALSLVEKAYPSPVRRQAAVKLLIRLAQGWDELTRLGGTSVRDFDHWSLIGYEALHPLLTDKLLAKANPRDRTWNKIRLLATAKIYCQDEFKRITLTGNPLYFGDWSGGDGRGTPGACRLEGIQAVRRLLVQAGDPTPTWDEPLQHGLSLLIRSQYVPDDHEYFDADTNVTGAVRRAVHLRDRRASEIRIDYCQHAISAWLGYQPQK